MEWAIVYDDLSVVTGQGEEAWKAAPTDGILFVVFPTAVLTSHDFYYYYDGATWFTDDLGPLLRKLGFIKFGRTTSPKNLESARQLAEEHFKVLNGS